MGDFRVGDGAEHFSVVEGDLSHALKTVREKNGVCRKVLGLAKEHDGNMEGIDTDVHQSGIAKGRGEGAPDIPRQKGIVAAGILAEIQVGITDFSDFGKGGFQQIIGRVKGRAHGFKEKFAFGFGVGCKCIKLFSGKAHGLFQKHVFACIKGAGGVGKMERVGDGNIDGIYIPVC